MTTLTRADWEARAKDLKIEGRAFVNGEYSNAASGETFDCLSPVDGRFLAKVASCDLADAEQAVKVARNAFDSGAWSRLAPAKRKQTMIRFADLLLENAEELALLETLDMGKPISDSLHIDVASAANSLRWSAEAIDKIYDEVAATPHAELGLVTREPVGVVAAIVPWNFPMIMTAWKLGPALATGQDTNDLISAAWEHEAEWLALPAARVVPGQATHARASGVRAPGGTCTASSRSPLRTAAARRRGTLARMLMAPASSRACIASLSPATLSSSRARSPARSSSLGNEPATRSTARSPGSPSWTGCARSRAASPSRAAAPPFWRRSRPGWRG